MSSPRPGAAAPVPASLGVFWLTGLLQALEHAGVNVYPALDPAIRSYYHGLTLHGVLNALVWTTLFICGFLPFVAVRDLETPLWGFRLAWATLADGGRAGPESVGQCSS